LAELYFQLVPKETFTLRVSRPEGIGAEYMCSSKSLQEMPDKPSDFLIDLMSAPSL
jgi:hypothetical protein